MHALRTNKNKWFMGWLIPYIGWIFTICISSHVFVASLFSALRSVNIIRPTYRITHPVNYSKLIAWIVKMIKWCTSSTAFIESLFFAWRRTYKFQPMYRIHRLIYPQKYYWSLYVTLFLDLFITGYNITEFNTAKSTCRSGVLHVWTRVPGRYKLRSAQSSARSLSYNKEFKLV